MNPSELQRTQSPRPTYQILSDDTRHVAHVMALLWSWSTSKSVYELLRGLGLTSATNGKLFTQDQVKLAQASLRKAGWSLERDVRPGHFRLADPFRAHMYAELLDRHPLPDLRRALHKQVGLPPEYSYYWQIYDSAATAAVFRLELFGGADDAALDRMRGKIAQRIDWGSVFGEACMDGFDGHLIERINATWRWEIAYQATASVSVRWHSEYLSIHHWALEQAATRWAEMPENLRHQLAAAQLHSGNDTGVMALLTDDNSAEANALRAATVIQKGNWLDGATGFEAALKQKQKETGVKKNAFFASLSWYYPMALLAQQTPPAVEKARKFCLAESGKRTPEISDGWGQWVHATSIRLGDAALQADTLKIHSALSSYPSLGSFWLILLRAWMVAELPLPTGKIQHNYYVDILAVLRRRLNACGLVWLEQQLLAADAVLTGKTINTTTPFFAGGGVEPWRNVLDSLLALGDGAESGKTSAKEGDTQLLWALSLGKGGTVDRIDPLEKKRGVRGWGVARATSLAKIFGQTGLAAHDAKVVRAIHQDRYQRGYTLDRASAIMALIGHPFVVLAGAHDATIDLVEGVPQLETVRKKSPTGESFILRVNPPAHSEADAPELWDFYSDEVTRKALEALRYITVIQDSPQRLRVIRLTPAQRRAAQLVSGRFSVPASAQADLQEALRALSGHFSIHSDEAAAAARQVPTESHLRAELAPAGDGLLLRLVVAPLGEHGPRLMPGHGRARVMASIAGESIGTERDLPAEQENLNAVLAALEFLTPPGAADTFCEWTVDEPELALSMVEILPGLPAVGAIDWPRGKAVKVTTLDTKQVQVSVRSERDWFRVDGQAQLDEGRVFSLQALLDAAASNSRFVALGEGAYLALSKSLRDKLQTLAAVAESDKHGLRAPQLAAAWLDEALDGLVVEFDAKFKQRLTRLRNAQEQRPAVPGGLQAELRAYQEDGFVWAMRLAHAEFGACLADDMGLGKTLQALAVMIARSAGGPALVVAPTSVCGNWLAEAGRFAPGLNVTIYGEAGREGLITAAGPGDVLLVSYTLMQQASEAFAARTWHTLVADEAQAVKNALAKRSQALFDIPADFRLALSGTPVENRLAELWSIMRFCNPGLLGTLTRFTERFATPIERNRDREAQRLLRRLIAPFVLRRTKTQVLDDLPPRTELIFSVVPDADEAAHYEALRRNAVSAAESLAGEGNASGQARFHILAQLTKLRRAACDPRLTTPDLGFVGAKVRAFAELASELAANGHKALVFSQFVDFLTLLRAPLDEAGITYQYLDGSTPAAERTRRVAAFQQGSGDLFLISLKAGGFGLNLTAADYVVITDPWWNPAAEDQAMGRAHRIGQLRPVTVYRLVSKGTLEERIIELHHDKRALAEGVLAEGAEGAALPSSAELIELMRG